MSREPFFRNIRAEYQTLLQQLFEPHSYGSGTVVIRQGAPAEFFYLLIDGRAQVSYKPYDESSPITVSHVGKNGLFGWSAVLGSRVYTSSVTAMEDLETYRIRGSRLRSLCQEYPEAGKAIMDQLATIVASRWKNSHEQVKSMLMQGLQS